jgi:aminopeptidase
MGETLYDENMWWPQGNTHIAIGSAYKDAYTGDMTSLSKSDREDLGFNDSAVHTDIISTAPRTVTATMTDGSKKVIYTDGMFTK